MTVAYLDEVGMSAVFGDLVACAVILPENFKDNRIRDSKQLKHKDIYSIASELKWLTHSFGIISSDELNIIKNIFKADQLAMIRAVQQLPERPTVLFIDGKIRLEIGMDCVSIVKGDEKILGIATASILAKNFRDHYIIDTYGKTYNQYDIISNKGYMSPKHKKAILNYGITRFHRKWMPRIQRLLSLTP